MSLVRERPDVRSASCVHVDVWSIDLDNWQGPVLAECLAVLDSAETTRAARFTRQEDAIRFVRAHAATRLLLAHATGGHAAKLRWDRSANGKPSRVLGVEWNLSHSEGMAQLAVVPAGTGAAGVGIDVQTTVLRFDASRFARRYLSPGEQRMLGERPSRGALAMAIARKEAAVKAVGLRLLDALDTDTSSSSTVVMPGTEENAARQVRIKALEPQRGGAVAVAVAVASRAANPANQFTTTTRDWLLAGGGERVV